MAIPIEKDPDHDCMLESCAICAAPTVHWTALPGRKSGEQVACCRWCAATKTPADVPTKAAWFKAATKKDAR